MTLRENVPHQPHARTTKTWLITGASKGFGRAFAEAALRRGDRVAATARDARALADLAAYPGALILELDVTDPGTVRDGVRKAEEAFDGLDVVVNNAGYGHFGAVEEVSDAELADQLETNLYGALRVTRAALPRMRERGRGHIVQISSIGGIGAFANLGAYHASKWALEAMSESLSVEVARFGVAVTLVEPGGFDTDWAGASARSSSPHPAYEAMRAEAAARRNGQAPGDPAAAAAALLEIVDMPHPPLRALFGAQANDIVAGIYGRRLDEWAAGRERAVRAQRSAG
jgi:NAD(P)-dependent dehydrogenase (short-subunit alcohol dehydrogenase family)